MGMDSAGNGSFRTTIAPWLSVHGGAKAVDFYKSAFGAEEVFHIEDPDGNVVARLSIDGAEFWVSDGVAEQEDTSPSLGSGMPVRMILTVADPDAIFALAVQAGASAIQPVSEEHGWRVGRVADPFGLHWEIGQPVAD
jgi:PhnB protein